MLGSKRENKSIIKQLMNPSNSQSNYIPKMSKTLKTIEELCSQATQYEYQQSRITWNNVMDLNTMRYNYTKWRGEKWIKRIWKETTITTEWKYEEEGNYVYIIFNTRTKKMLYWTNYKIN